MNGGFTDIHQHLMYDIDDGPETREAAEEMIAAAARDGITRIVVTPHVEPGLRPFDIELYRRRLDSLQNECARRHGVKLLTGAEIFYTEATRRHLNERRVLTLADTEYVLVEFPTAIRFESLIRALDELSSGGYVPVLAHAERYRCLVTRPPRAIELKKRLGVRFQINCSTIMRNKPYFVSRFCKKLLGDGIIDAVATDAHDLTTRPVMMTAAYQLLEKKYGESYSARLTGKSGGFI